MRVPPRIPLSVPFTLHSIVYLLYTLTPGECGSTRFIIAVVTLAGLVVVRAYYEKAKVMEPRRPFIAFGRVALHWHGALVPLVQSLSVLPLAVLLGPLRLNTLVIATSLAITISLVNTSLSSACVMVNAIRYSIAYFFLVISVVSPLERAPLYYLLPFTTQIGVILGSDMLAYLLLRRNLLGSGKLLIVGGAGDLDAIAISSSAVMLFALVYYLTVGFSP